MTVPSKTNRGFRVLILGCGELGSRHLQAVASMPQVTEVEVVDPRQAGLDLGRQRLSELPTGLSPTSFRWLSSWEEATRDSDLCIVATQAHGRHRLVRDVSTSLGCRSFILEKLVAQSVNEIECLIDFARENRLSAWVNCSRRSFPTYKRIKQRLDSSEPIAFNVVGGNQHLATNGIHATDLFAFYDECNSIIGSGSRIDTVLHSSKRGGSLYDLSGTLSGYSEKGSTLAISYLDTTETWEQISIATKQYRCIIDYLQQSLFESDSESNWAWRQSPIEPNLLVSDTTKEFTAEILESGQCSLPTLEESLVAHRFILGGLQSHFNKLLGLDLDHCPVT